MQDRAGALGMAQPRPHRRQRVGGRSLAAGTMPWDWFHINSIDPQPNGDLFISARNTWAGYQLQAAPARSSGDSAAWTAPSRWARARRPPGSTTAASSPDGDVTFFDDGSNPPKEPQSRGVRDRARHEATTPRGWSPRSRTRARRCWRPARATCRRSPTATRVVGYGGVPEISEYAPGGSLLFDAHLPSTSSSTAPSATLERAARRPRRRSSRASTTSATRRSSRMSWNGATGVASWRVLAGARARRR